MSLHSDTLFWFRATQSLLFLLNAALLIGEAANTNFIFYGLTWPWIESTIFHTLGEHTNHYTTDAVHILLKCLYLAVKKVSKVIYFTSFCGFSIDF